MWYVDYVVFVGSEAGFIGSREKSGSSSCETSFSPPNMELYRGDRRNMQRDLVTARSPGVRPGLSKGRYGHVSTHLANPTCPVTGPERRAHNLL
ncbi:hypothetical protein DY000_02007719 [Brassica cretica]|uniref:Uncharacterized protein n=1 Tax=Brassica cretica TaxID=69181 RepID=A0ABQ7BXV8_BRACR|nr:hypothetical protein DY000_02007719 [Brassica cretica]